MQAVPNGMPVGFEGLSTSSSVAAPRPPHDLRGQVQMSGGKGAPQNAPSGSQFGGGSKQGVVPCPPHLVPVEQANAMLLAVTSEYENILNIQRDQHQLGQRQRYAEISQLRQYVEVLERDRSDEDSISALLKAKEDEFGLGFEEKCREVDLLSNLLRMRDAQIAHLQTLNEMKAVQLRQFSAASPMMSPPPQVLARQEEEKVQRRQTTELADSLTEALGTVTRLQKEKSELEQLVVAKEKQLGLVHSVDPSLSDSSALQLGAQAIQMFHDSMRMRAENARSEDQAEELRVELERLRSHVEYLESVAEEKREEMRELSDSLGAKMKRIIDLETEVEDLRRDQRNTSKDVADQVEKLQAGLLESQESERLKQGFAEQLQEELQDKNQRMLHQQAEFMQCKENAKHLEEKLQKTSGQLDQAEEALAQMLRSTTYKDRLVREMTEQVNISETKLHAYQVNEVLGSRQRQLEQRAVETDLSQTLREKEALVGRLSSELAETRLKAGRDSRDSDPSAIPSISGGGIGGSSLGNVGIGGLSGIAPLRRSSSSGGLLGVSGALGALGGRGFGLPKLELDVTGTSNWLLESGTTADSQQNSPRASRASSRGLSASPTPNSFMSHQVSHCYGVPRFQPSPSLWNGSVLDDANVRVVNVRRPSDLGYVANASIMGHHSDFAAPPSFQNPLPPLPTLSGVHGDAGNSSGSTTMPQQTGYLPQPGDALDAKVADFVNQPQNSHCRALFCRLSEGAYLFGTHRTKLRISPQGEQLEAFEDNAWMAIAEFVRRKTGSQMVHLQKACMEVGTSNGALPVGAT